MGQFAGLEYIGEIPNGRTPRLFYSTLGVDFALACSADLALPVGTLDIFDIVAFLGIWSDPNATGTEAEEADFNRDGSRDIMDVMDFLTAWHNGCPA